VRLAKPPLVSDFAGEDQRWRDAGRLLAGSRDTTVLLKCFDELAATRDRRFSGGRRQGLRMRIASHCENGSGDIEEKLRQVLALLGDAEASVAELDWPNSKGALLHGFRRAQKRLRRDWKTARATAEPEALHSWRKRVKDQAAQLRLFRRVMPFRKRISAEKETAELLGDEHDLWLLSEQLRDCRASASLGALCDGLLLEIEQRRSALRAEAFGKGESFSSQKAKDLVTEDQRSMGQGDCNAKAKREIAPHTGARTARVHLLLLRGEDAVPLLRRIFPSFRSASGRRHTCSGATPAHAPCAFSAASAACANDPAR
jgi:CHAD domain-containing protein